MERADRRKKRRFYYVQKRDKERKSCFLYWVSGTYFPKSTEQYFKQPFFPYSISIFRVSSRPSHFEQNN